MASVVGSVWRPGWFTLKPQRSFLSNLVRTSYQVLHNDLHASLPVIVHKLEDDGLRGRLGLASWLVHLEAPEVLPLELGEGMHHDGGKREIEQSSKLNDTRTKAGNLELLNSADGAP